MNKAIVHFGIKTVMDNMRQFIANYPTDIALISVGSGNGALESRITEDCGKNIICVDPDPKSYYRIPEIVKVPDYPLVKDLVSASPEIVGNCLLLLNWCNPNDSEYDFEAIQLLKPIAFISIYESFLGDSGAAGGEKFFKYIHNTDEYNLIHLTAGIESGLRIEWYQRSNVEHVPTHDLETEVELEIPWEEDKKCLIM